jgi:hypothetical protein
MNNAMGNVHRSKPVNVSLLDFEDINGFFIRSNGAGVIKYCPLGNGVDEYIEKTVEAQVYFVDPEVCWKIFASGTTATGVYVGYGV